MSHSPNEELSRNAYDRLCPQTCTNSAVEYWHRHVQNFEMWTAAEMIAADMERLVVERNLFPLSLRIRANEITKASGQPIDEGDHAELLAKRDRRDPTELAHGDDAHTIKLSKWIHRDLDPVMTELFIIRTVDNMLTYLADILIEVHRARPETLRSGAKVAYEDVLSHQSMEGFIEWAAEDRVESLSRKGFRQLADEIESRLGLKLLSDTPEALDSIVLLVAVRNLLVHRRGRIDRRFIEMLHTERLGRLGQPVDLEVVQSSNALGRSVDIVERFDMQVAVKYGLDVVPLDARPSWADFVCAGQRRRRAPGS